MRSAALFDDPRRSGRVLTTSGLTHISPSRSGGPVPSRSPRLPWRGHAAAAVTAAVTVAVFLVVLLGWTERPAQALSVGEAEAAVDGAKQQLAGAHQRVRAAQATITEAASQLGDLQADQLVLTEQLRSKRGQARQLSVAAYIAGGSEPDLQFLVDVEKAGDILWRQTMLAQQSIETRTVAREFLGLRNGTSEEVNRTVDRLDRLDQRLEEARQEVPHAERAVALAEITLVGVRQAEAAARAARDAAAVGGDKWANLRHCESGGNYGVNSGNGFYGAYQFDLQTWRSMGGTGIPSDAPPWEQDARARALYSSRGAQPWPICGQYLL